MGGEADRYLQSRPSFFPSEREYSGVTLIENDTCLCDDGVTAVCSDPVGDWPSWCVVQRICACLWIDEQGRGEECGIDGDL